MAGEIILASTEVISQARDIAIAGAHISKPIGGAIVTAVALGTGTYYKLHRSHSSEPGEKKEAHRVRRLPPGFLGLVEVNGKLHKNIPVHDIGGHQHYADNGQPIFIKEYRKVLHPGWRATLMPLRLCAVIDTRDVSRKLDPTKVISQNNRQYDIEARFKWSHIKGFHDKKHPIPYHWQDGSPVPVEELIERAYMSGRNEQEKSEMVEGIIGSLLVGHRSTLEDASKHDHQSVFSAVKQASHDSLLAMGSELHDLRITKASPTDADHVINDFDFSRLSTVFHTIAGMNPDVEPGLRVVGDDHAL